MNTPVLEIGYAESDITPQPGTALSGFIFRENKPSTHVDDPLYVRVLVVCDRDEVYFLINYELLGLSRELERHILDALSTGLGAAFLRMRAVLVATHTHSAPPACPLEGEAEVDPLYRDLLCGRTVEAARRALTSAQPATLHMAALRVPGYTFNRRAVLVDGRVSMAPLPDAPALERGPVDDTLTAFVWRDMAGRNIAALMHFACHGVAICAQGIGGDIPGELARRVADLLGAPCLFLQGAAGDINPTAVAGDQAGMLEWAAAFCPHIERLPALLFPVSCLPFRASSTIVHLEYQSLPARAVLLRSIENFERIAARDVDSPEVQETLRRLSNLMNFRPGERPDVSKAAYASRALANAEHRTLAALDAAESGNPPAPYPLRVALWQIGQFTLAFVSAELFALTGFHIRALGRGRAMLPVTYAAPIAGYVPDRASMEKGGYEVDDAWRFYRHPAPFQPDSEARIVEAIATLNATLAQAGE